jgi:hypothetical protein
MLYALQMRVKQIGAAAEPPSIDIELAMALGHGQVAVVMIRVTLHRKSADSAQFRRSWASAANESKGIAEAKLAQQAGAKLV